MVGRGVMADFQIHLEVISEDFVLTDKLACDMVDKHQEKDWTKDRTLGDSARDKVGATCFAFHAHRVRTDFRPDKFSSIEFFLNNCFIGLV